MNEHAVMELDDLDLEEVHAGAQAKGTANQTCGYLRKGAALCESLGLGNDAKPTSRR